MRAVTRDTFPGSLGKRLADIEAKLERLFTMAASSPKKEVSSGDFIIYGGGDLKIVDDDGNVVFSTLDGPQKAATAQTDIGSIDLSTGWSLYADTDVAVPAGYTRANVLLYTATGASFTGVGNGLVGSAPYITYAGGDVTGPGISNGTPGAGSVSVTSFMSANLTGLAGGVITLQAYAYATGAAEVVGGSGNVHLSAQVVFLR